MPHHHSKSRTRNRESKIANLESTITERANPASVSLETETTQEILRLINREDRKVAPAVARVLPQIARAVELAAKALARGGKLVYLGAGTSGRLGVLDAAECIPTFGTDRVQALMAGGPAAMFRPTEISEDNPRLAARDLRRLPLASGDVLVGVSAGGTTPYTLAGLRYARRLGAATVALTCNPAAPFRRLADLAIVPVVGPEIIAGSSRMKAGTAQKLVLNMLSTATMARLGRVLAGRMIHVQMNNRKLRERGRRILMSVAGASAVRAKAALQASGGDLPVALVMLKRRVSRREAQRLLGASASLRTLLRPARQG
jgi:N-acetylmuramic acid 6-phosphate etherase